MAHRICVNCPLYGQSNGRMRRLGSLSAQAVSRISRSLDDEVRRFQERRLRDDSVYLFFDGVTMKVKGAAGAKMRIVLCAYGIRSDGVRELLSFRKATAGSAAQ